MDSTRVSSDRARFNFGWQGPTILSNDHQAYKHVTKIGIEFEGARTQYSVDLDEDINPDTPQQYFFKGRQPLFTVVLISENSEIFITMGRETRPEVLTTTLDRMRALKVTAHFCTHVIGQPEIEMSTWQFSIKIPIDIQKKTESVRLENPQDLVAGKLYQLVVSSNGHLLSARFVEQANRSSENKDGI